MTITINTPAIGKFLLRHKEAVFVACVSAIIIRNQAKTIQSYNNV